MRTHLFAYAASADVLVAFIFPHRMDDAATDHGEKRRDGADLVGRHGKIVTAQYREVGELAQVERAAFVAKEFRRTL